MTHQEILEKAIKKAIEGGWKHDYKVRFTVKHSDTGTISTKTSLDDWDTYALIIFNHDFAKALWGEFTEADHNHAEKKLYETASKLDHKKAEAILSQGVLEPWQYHLMQMVISEDPIKYLGDNI